MKRIIPAFLVMLIFVGSSPVKADVVTDWNETALQAIRDAATAPPVASRSLAITHAAIFDSVNSIYSTYKPYYEKLPGYSTASPEAAVAWAGYTALTSLFGSNPKFDTQLTASLAAASGTPAQKALGQTLGTTIATSVFFNITASDQYIAIVVPGRMFAGEYKKRKLKPEVLSRTLEDGGTLTSVLVPWNTCGATQSRVLGVPTIEYLPFAFFNILSPFFSILFASINYRIRREIDPSSEAPDNK